MFDNNFLGFMTARANVENIIKECIAARERGEEDYYEPLEDSVYLLDDSDLEYIRNEVEKRIY